MLLIGNGNIDTADLLSQQNQNKDKKIYQFVCSMSTDQKYIEDVVAKREDIDILGYLQAIKNMFDGATYNRYYVSFALFGINRDPGNILFATRNLTPPDEAMKVTLNIFQEATTPSFAGIDGNIRKNLTLVDDNVRRYILKYNVEPYILNTLRFEEIYLLVTQTPYFPKTRNMIINAEVSKIEPAYEDIPLPLHPFWNGPILDENLNAIDYRNKSRGASFTEPDFYLANPSVDYEYQESIEGDYGLEISDKNLANKVKGTPQDLYNLYVDLAAEYSRGDVEGIMKKSDLVNSDRFAAKKLDINKPVNTEKIDRTVKDNFPEIGDIEISANKQMVPISSEYYKLNVTPKNFISPEKRSANNIVNLAGVDSNNNPLLKGPEWGGNRVNASDLSFIFGDNLDLMDPLVSSFDYNGEKLKTSRLLNWSYQEYDFEGHEIRKGRLRNEYAIDKMPLPKVPGVSGIPTRDSEGNINFFASEYYYSDIQQSVDSALTANQCLVERTNAFGQVREESEKEKAEFSGDELIDAGANPELKEGQGGSGIPYITKGKTYRFHKGIDIWPSSQWKNTSSTSFSIIDSSFPKVELFKKWAQFGIVQAYNPETGQLNINREKGRDNTLTDEEVEFTYSGTYTINPNAKDAVNIEYNNLIPLFAPWDLEFEGGFYSGLYDSKWEITGDQTRDIFRENIWPYFKDHINNRKTGQLGTSNVAMDILNNPDYVFWKDSEGKIVGVDKNKRINGKTFEQRINENTVAYLSAEKIKYWAPRYWKEAFERDNAAIKAEIMNMSYDIPLHIFTDPYTNKTWLVFKNGKDWGDNAAGCRSAWKINSGPFTGATLLLYHQSYMLNVEQVYHALREDGRITFRGRSASSGLSTNEDLIEDRMRSTFRGQVISGGRSTSSGWNTNEDLIEDFKNHVKTRNILGIANFLITYEEAVIGNEFLLPDVQSTTSTAAEIEARKTTSLFVNSKSLPVYPNGVSTVSAGQFIGFIGRTGFSETMSEHAHVEICYKTESGKHVTKEGSIAWRIDLGPLLEKGTKAPDSIINAYYASPSFNSRYMQLGVDGYFDFIPANGATGTGSL